MIETRIRQDDTVVCKPRVDLDWRTSVSLRHAVHDALRPGVRVLIDLSRVSYIDAVGLSAIAATLRRARAVGALVRVYNIQPPVRRRMELVGVGGFVTSLTGACGNDAALQPFGEDHHAGQPLRCDHPSHRRRAGRLRDGWRCGLDC